MQRQLVDKAKNDVIHDKQVNVTLLGDSTLDNRIWVDGLVKSYLYTRLGIQRDESSVRIKKSHRILGKPDLSVVENIMDMLPDHVIHDFTNDGFTTHDVLHGAYRDKVFGTGRFSLFPHEYFQPLQNATESIKNSQHIIVSIGGNDFREFLMIAGSMNGEARKNLIKYNLDGVLARMRDNYITILERIRTANKDAQIILMTQYYPSATQNNYEIYPFMQEIGDALNLGGTSHNPMTVIHEIMKMTYGDVLKRVPHNNIVVADITSSLNPYANENHVSQIEPSDLGGKKIAQMLKYIMTSDNITSNLAYRFYPEFFTTENQDNHVESSNFDQWAPTHPYDLRGSYTYAEEKLFRQYNADQLNCDDLLKQLNQTIEKQDKSSPMYKAAMTVRQAGENLSRAIAEEDIKKWKMSVVLAINILDTPIDKPEHQAAIRLLQENAERRAIAKADGWKQLQGALAMLAGAAIIGLSIAGIPFSIGVTIGLAITGSSLAAGGANCFYRNRQQSLSRATADFAKEASRVHQCP